MKKVDIWEMPLSLSTESIPLVIKGKLIKSSFTTNAYIFKFIGPSESEVRAIFEEIKKHSPVRGYIS